MLKWGLKYLSQAALVQADLDIEQRRPWPAAGWLALAMAAAPQTIRRRLYSWRQVLSLMAHRR
jgi:hypothetical protein